MFLLNPIDALPLAPSMAFTFHYVSIKSMLVILLTSDNIGFTFHYVSIKSVVN